MTEFQPEDTTPTPYGTAQGGAPNPGNPQAQGQPFDPRQPYTQQPPAPGTAYPGPQGTPVAPPAYGSAAPPFQPYGEPVPVAAKKRKVWPWVLGGVGALVVLGVGVIVAALVIGKAAVDGLNPNYSAPAVTQQDVAKHGGTLIISDDSVVAFEVDPSWVDQKEMVGAQQAVNSAASLSYAGAWSTADLTKGKDVSLVTVVVGQEKIPLIRATLNAEHQAGVKGFMNGFPASASNVQVSDATAASTASGLDGLHSTFSANLKGLNIVGDLYTFARGKNFVLVQVTSYNGTRDPAAVKQILDTLRLNS